MTLLELLAKGEVEAFNASRGVRARVDLFAADLSGARIPGVDLSGANVAKSDLTGADLSEANLLKADLVGIDGASMRLCRALAHRARLREAYLEEADLSDADFTRGDLSEAVLVGSHAERAKFTGARLKEVDATGAVWTDADLAEAYLHKANLSGADLSRADLTEAVATEANFGDAILDGITASRAKLQGASFVQASLVGARLDGASLENADLTGADLSTADLSRANLTGAKLAGANLRGACLASACLDDVDLAEVDLTEADLSGLDPSALGLSSDQEGSVAAIGAEAEATSPMAIRAPGVAATGERFVVFWSNPEGTNEEGEEKASLRWARATDLGAKALVLPIGGEGVHATWVLPGAAEGEAMLLFVQERPGGTMLVAYPVTADGRLGVPQTWPFGYTPVGAPALRLEGAGVRITGLARRGPTAVVHQLAGGELTLLHSQKVPTAADGYGRFDLVLACKGGVVMPISARAVGAPLRTPEGFPGLRATAAPWGDSALVVWVEPEREQAPGGIRWSVLPKRGAPEARILTADARVRSLDVLASADGVWLCWVQGSETEGFVVGCSNLPEAVPEPIRVPRGFEPVEARFVLADPSSEPTIALVGSDGSLRVVDRSGAVLATVC